MPGGPKLGFEIEGGAVRFFSSLGHEVLAIVRRKIIRVNSGFIRPGSANPPARRPRSGWTGPPAAMKSVSIGG